MNLRSAALVLIALVWAPTLSVAGPSVVLDPGHGGSKAPGARSAAGIAEKDVVLGIAKAAERALEASGVKVRLTRDQDTDLELDERIRIANDGDTLAFVSIHANFAPVPGRRGVETYVLAPSASKDVRTDLIAHENEESVEDVEAPAPADGLSAILDDLSKMRASKDSAALAKRIQDSVGSVSELSPSRGLRQAPFKVLRGVRAPSALIEIGYMSNPAQSTKLAQRKVQVRAGRALAQGILRFLKDRKARHKPSR